MVSVVITSCKDDDEESDYEKGKKAGAAWCDCMTKAGEDEAAQLKCESTLDESKFVDSEDPAKWNEYQKGALEGMFNCLGE
jgi:hypothetical protein